jgi:RNA polymerase sigma-70 factor (ECF subfamily)
LPPQLADIYEAHFDFVWRNARRLGVPASYAQDVVQDVFIVVQRRLPDFRGEAIRPWLFGILARVVKDYARSHRRKAGRWIPFSSDTMLGELQNHSQSPSDSAERAERMRLLDACLEQLSEDQRKLIVLSELEQWTLREVAEFFGTNINTVHTRLRAAKQRFAKAYARARAKLGDEP